MNDLKLFYKIYIYLYQLIYYKPLTWAEVTSVGWICKRLCSAAFFLFLRGRHRVRSVVPGVPWKLTIMVSTMNAFFQ